MRLPKGLAPVALLVWVGLFAAAQALSVAHQHTDDSADAACVVCTLVKSHTAATDSHVASTPPAADHGMPPVVAAPPRVHAPASVFQARAPPLA